MTGVLVATEFSVLRQRLVVRQVARVEQWAWTELAAVAEPMVRCGERRVCQRRVGALGIVVDDPDGEIGARIVQID